VIGNPAIQSEPAEPAIGQIEVNLVAEAALGPNAHAVVDDQHADHQLGIDRGPAHLAVKRLRRLTEVIEGEMSINAPKHVIDRDVFLKAEIIEQPRRRSLKAHHRLSPANQQDSMNHDTPSPAIKQPLFQRYRPTGSVLHAGPVIVSECGEAKRQLAFSATP
jgi:hypothetical protein